MDSKSFLFVANWKMYLTVGQTLDYCKVHREKIDEIAHGSGHSIVVCPSYPAMAMVCQLFKQTSIHVGGQTCSSFTSGAYTGDVSAGSLAEVGCTYCIIGHSERRRYCHETNQDIVDKARCCVQAGLTPIVCIGEFSDQQNIKTTAAELAEQMSLLCNFLVSLDYPITVPLWIAYEPVWSIGTGKLPSETYLSSVYGVLAELVAGPIKMGVKVAFMYGGSLDDKNISIMARINAVDGFLIGGSSLDFQKFKNMISLTI